MGSRFGYRKILSVRDQVARIRLLFPHFRCSVKGGTLIAEGELQPTERSVAYHVRIEYQAGDPPEVNVLTPELKPREDGGQIPHVYRGNRLCLYLPGAGEWTSDLSLAHTIVPWISEWLFFYETWHALGVWLGGGIEPGENKTIRREEKEKTHERQRR
jgi:hypothetical protein